jgi:hypothetical protein
MSRLRIRLALIALASAVALTPAVVLTPAAATPGPLPVSSVLPKAYAPAAYVPTPKLSIHPIQYANECNYMVSFFEVAACRSDYSKFLVVKFYVEVCPAPCVFAYEIIVERKWSGGVTVALTDGELIKDINSPNRWGGDDALIRPAWAYGDCFIAKARSHDPPYESQNSAPQCLPSTAPINPFATPTPRPPPSVVSAPNLILISTASDCSKLTPGLFGGGWFGLPGSCEADLKAGNLWFHWAWARVPCGSMTCLDADGFIFTHKPGVGFPVDIRWRDVEVGAGTWRFGDCFVIRARNSVVNIDSADSNVVCVPRPTAPVLSPAPVKI